jgi:hypothetical protein
VILQHSFSRFFFYFVSHFLRLIDFDSAYATPAAPFYLFIPPSPVVVKSINFVLVTVIYKMVEFLLDLPLPLLCVCVCVCVCVNIKQQQKNTITSLNMDIIHDYFSCHKKESFLFFNNSAMCKEKKGGHKS